MKITNRFTGEPIYEGDHDTIAECVEAALESGVYLRGADLRNANLRDTDLGGADLRNANLRDTKLPGANLRDTDLGGANLRDTDLGGAYIGGAYLGGADLRGADLRGAKYGDGIPISVPPLYLTGLLYDVLILDHHIKIGCEMYSIDYWEAATEETVRSMGGDSAVQMWRDYGAQVFALARAHQAQCREGAYRA